jgi:hypothetical protein
MLTQTIPSYLYVQYDDDPDLQAFITAFNQTAQQYVNFFNQIGLPIYTGSPIAGTLLDWVAQGIYGMVRPSLPGSGTNRVFGPLNTYAFNTMAFNQRKVVAPSNFYATTDDIFKRIITWNFFKGDGQVFNIRWLKRRILRFLLGANGVDPGINQTYQVSVTFGANNQVNINIRSHTSTLVNGALFNRNAFNKMTFNGFKVQTNHLTPLPNANILASAIQAGVVNLPFQFTYIVNIE